MCQDEVVSKLDVTDDSAYVYSLQYIHTILMIKLSSGVLGRDFPGSWSSRGT